MNNKEDLYQALLAFLSTLATAVTYVCLIGFIVMLLWNWLMPMIFGLTILTYGQTVGFVVLCNLLFKGVSNVRSK